LYREAMTFIPTVIETTHRGEREMGIGSRLLRDRIVFLGSEVDDAVSNYIVAQLLILEGEDPDKEITMYINSPGGVITAGLAIYDTMQYVRCPISTICVGMAASMGAVLLTAGTKGKRRTLPNSRIMIHQPLGGARGQASDIEIQAREILKMKEKLTRIIADHSGQPFDRVVKDGDRDYYMSADEARDYGLIDEVFKPQKNLLAPVPTEEKK
jgi:ATP-dependent Clp protease protease subunit